MVYSVPCIECSRAYIGQTGRSLDHHIAEHRQALRNGDVAASALAEHVFTAGHQVDLLKARVLMSRPAPPSCNNAWPQLFLGRCLTL